jgi:hypothetical protein
MAHHPISPPVAALVVTVRTAPAAGIIPSSRPTVPAALACLVFPLTRVDRGEDGVTASCLLFALNPFPLLPVTVDLRFPLLLIAMNGFRFLAVALRSCRSFRWFDLDTLPSLPITVNFCFPLLLVARNGVRFLSVAINPCYSFLLFTLNRFPFLPVSVDS